MIKSHPFCSTHSGVWLHIAWCVCAVCAAQSISFRPHSGPLVTRSTMPESYMTSTQVTAILYKDGSTFKSSDAGTSHIPYRSQEVASFQKWKLGILYLIRKNEKEIHMNRLLIPNVIVKYGCRIWYYLFQASLGLNLIFMNKEYLELWQTCRLSEM